MLDKKSLDDLCVQTQSIAIETGRFIAAESQKKSRINVVEKDLNSLVSYVDQKAENMIVDGLKPLLDAAFLTEEETVAHKKADYTWIIDPLDGTTNFLFGIPVYAVSIALRYKDETILGVVHEVCQNETFSAHQFSGAMLNGSNILVSDKTTVAKSLFATGFPYYDFTKTTNYLQILSSLVQSSRGVRRMGAAAVDLAYVACGRFDGFFEYSLQPWDVAAGSFIVQKAGGKVADFSGQDNYLFGKEIIAANPNVFDELLHLVKKYMKP